MDADRFDRLARALTGTRSRRGALAALLGGPLGLLGLADTAAKKKKKGKKKKKKKGRNPPPAPTCVDGIRNGSESDIDCGGSCPRCASGKSCLSSNDCASTFCTGGTCQACTQGTQGMSCGTDASEGCVCAASSSRTPACVKNEAGQTVNSCTSCPTGTVCYEVAGTPKCYKLCDAS